MSIYLLSTLFMLHLATYETVVIPQTTEKDSTHHTSSMSMEGEPKLIIFGNLEEELPLEILVSADLVKQTTRKTPKTTQKAAGVA
ncbi:hypothetical protein X801_04161 [Opisthorchis viverrini]|uniref:Uncharacterized protein n=1 Tax=Opisthorchis viverrini TaxID=6198 RepID=A0A1S8WZQ8_OPIVI|nr:hypothetical protein X801_04161 [Opisthorchis viverrini]